MRSARPQEALDGGEEILALLLGLRVVAGRERVGDAVPDVILEELQTTLSSAVDTAAICVRMSMQ